MQKAEQIALGISGLVSGASKVFAPLVWLLTASTNGILRLLGIDPDEDDDQVTEEEIRMMVDAGSEKGAIDNEEKDMIQNVFEFDDLTIDEICVHRTDVDLLWLEDSMEEWEQLIHESRHRITRSAAKLWTISSAFWMPRIISGFAPRTAIMS